MRALWMLGKHESDLPALFTCFKANAAQMAKQMAVSGECTLQLELMESSGRLPSAENAPP